MSDRYDRLHVANDALATYVGRLATRIREDPSGYLVVDWTMYWKTPPYGESRRWMAHGDSDFPTWHKRAPWGGTQFRALHALISWIKGNPAYGIKAWEYWSSDTIKLCNQQTVNTLRAAGYPDGWDLENPCSIQTK